MVSGDFLDGLEVFATAESKGKRKVAGGGQSDKGMILLCMISASTGTCVLPTINIGHVVSEDYLFFDRRGGGHVSEQNTQWLPHRGSSSLVAVIGLDV